jgi:hypothetical protein
MLVFSVEIGEFPEYHVRYALKERFAETKQFPDVDMTEVLKEHGIPDDLIGDMNSPNVYTFSRFDIDVHDFIKEISKYGCEEYDPYQDYIENSGINLDDFRLTIIEIGQEK